MFRSAGHRGFTLVELLVIIVIIAILMALLLPAISAARAAARLMQCRNNAHQIGVALAGYHNVFKTFPYASTAPGGAAQGWNSTQCRRNWIIMLLPFLEEQNLYDTVDWRKFPIGQGGLTYADPTTSVAYYGKFTSAEIPVLLCPADKHNANKLLKDRSGNQFAAPVYQTMGRTNYGANASLIAPFYWGTPNPWKNRGVMGMNSSLSARQITDGLSHSVTVWEMRAGITQLDYRGTWADGRPGGSTVWSHQGGPNPCSGGEDSWEEYFTTFGSIAPGAPSSIKARILRDECMMIGTSASGTCSGSPRSSHPGGLNGLFADGSVRFISDFIERSGSYNGQDEDTSDMRTWERINVAADGETVEESKLQ